MEPFELPSDEAISAAYAEGKEAVIALFHQLAARLGALEEPPDAKPAAQMEWGRRVIHQGDIFWAAVEEPGIPHPCVVIQEDVINRSRVETVVVCALTSNRKRVSAPGNVLLEAGEANLLRQSVVEVSKVSAVAKTQLGEYIGSLSEQRVKEILAGMQFLQILADAREDE